MRWPWFEVCPWFLSVHEESAQLLLVPARTRCRLCDLSCNTACDCTRALCMCHMRMWCMFQQSACTNRRWGIASDQSTVRPPATLMCMSAWQYQTPRCCALEPCTACGIASATACHGGLLRAWQKQTYIFDSENARTTLSIASTCRSACSQRWRARSECRATPERALFTCAADPSLEKGAMRESTPAGGDAPPVCVAPSSRLRRILSSAWLTALHAHGHVEKVPPMSTDDCLKVERW
jgi:hypothetical protein